MPRRRKRRPQKGRRRVALWLSLVLLAIGVGVLGGYLYREVPPALHGRRVNLEPFQAILGPLDSAATTRVRVADRNAALDAMDRLRRVAAQVTDAHISEAKPGRDTLKATLYVAERTYRVELWWLVPTERPEPRLVVVIDDLGGNREDAERFLALPFSVTPAILPNLPYSKAVVTLARADGREFLLHLPMEPQGYPDVNPGDGALLAEMDEGALKRALEKNLSLVSGAAGVNNHMGSRLTELDKPMSWVMEELSERGLYFLDSLTSPKSVAAEAAARAGVRWARRDVFLDNVQKEAAILQQIDKAVKIARRKGWAVAIGHPHGATLRALEHWAPMLPSSGVRVVPLGDILHLGDGV